MLDVTMNPYCSPSIADHGFAVQDYGDSGVTTLPDVFGPGTKLHYAVSSNRIHVAQPRQIGGFSYLRSEDDLLSYTRNMEPLPYVHYRRDDRRVEKIDPNAFTGGV